MQFCIFLIVIGVAVVTHSLQDISVQDAVRDRRSSRNWPVGTYGLPMPKSGCPKGHFWRKGTRFHDTEDDSSKNAWSNPYNLAGHIARNDMEQKFCIKTQQRITSNDRLWPKGEYCIFKKWSCPSGFGEGYIFWDDEDDNNRNSYSGTLPDGQYDRDTTIHFCCRTDGQATTPIYLPTNTPFVLFRLTHQCQRVHGMKVDYQYFFWDTEDDDRRTASKWPHPKFDYSFRHDITLHYCYYYK